MVTVQSLKGAVGGGSWALRVVTATRAPAAPAPPGLSPLAPRGSPRAPGLQEAAEVQVLTGVLEQ